MKNLLLTQPCFTEKQKFFIRRKSVFLKKFMFMPFIRLEAHFCRNFFVLPQTCRKDSGKYSDEPSIFFKIFWEWLFPTKGKRQEFRILCKALYVHPLFSDNFNPTQTILHFYDSMILLIYTYTFVEFQVLLYYLSENALYIYIYICYIVL